MSAEGNITMKLLIDTKARKVLFAEGGKECADFLFHLLALPIGTVVRCLGKEAMVGGLGQLYDSFEALGIDYMDAGVSKECLLNPKVAVGSAAQVPLLMIQQAPASSPKRFYGCPANSSGSLSPPSPPRFRSRRPDYSFGSYSPANSSGSCRNYVSDGVGAICPRCNSTMNEAMTYVAGSSVAVQNQCGGGYVKGVVTYMIMDDLTVKPLSTISSITLLNKFNVKDVGCLQEKEVNLDMNRGSALLKASLTSKSVLTDVFLDNNGV